MKKEIAFSELANNPLKKEIPLSSCKELESYTKSVVNLKNEQQEIN